MLLDRIGIAAVAFTAGGIVMYALGWGRAEIRTLALRREIRAEIMTEIEPGFRETGNAELHMEGWREPPAGGDDTPTQALPAFPAWTPDTDDAETALQRYLTSMRDRTTEFIASITRDDPVMDAAVAGYENPWSEYS